MPPGYHGIDDDTIRARCASPEAAYYTLYVRRLVTDPALPGGQAEILRTAATRGILPIHFTRQTLSEHLSGRYRHGPPWSTTEMIICCLPDHTARESIRAEAAALHQAAARHHTTARQDTRRSTPGRTGSDNTGPDSLVDRRRGEDLSDPTTAAPVRRPNAPRADPPGTANRRPARNTTPANRRRAPNTAAVADARPDANQSTGPYRRGPAKSWSGRDIAVDIADLRADCARLTVLVLLTGEPGTHQTHSAELSAALERQHRSPLLGQLSQRIEPAAPLPRRALAQYLCAYAELGRTDATELATRTRLSPYAIADILAARRMPTETELRQLGAVLGVDGTVLWQLAAHARGVRLGTSGANR